MQQIIAAPLSPTWDTRYTTGEEWRAFANKQAGPALAALPGLRERMHVTVTPSTMNGVRVYIVRPDVIPPEHRNKILIQVHGGCYVLQPGEVGTQEAIMIAGFGHYEVIAVDYRMPPEGYFPAALDDAMTVYQAVLKKNAPKNIGVLGTSAGGALVLEMMLRAKQLGLPMPGAIAPSTPMADVTTVGDSFYTNAMVDNVLVSPDGFCDAATKVYAHGHDLSDPLLSPVYGDMNGFPPTILTTGTRDLLLSNTVRVHRKLRAAGVEAQLEVFEGESHAQFGRDDRLPEAKEAFGEIAHFFDKHLGH
jgi:acetyl esterase/lipase